MRVFNDVRYTCRLLLRSPGWALAVVLSLSLGVAANAIVFSLIDAVLLKPFPYAKPDRLVFIWGGKTVDVTRGISVPDLKDWRSLTHSFHDIDAFLGNLKFSLGPDASDTIRGACIGADVLPLLGVRPMLGRNFMSADEAGDLGPVAILSHSLWQSRFGGDPTILDRQIRLNDIPHQVIGVTPAGFFFPDTDARLWVTAPCGLPGYLERGRPLVHAVALLKDGVSLTAARADLEEANRRLANRYPDTNRDTVASLMPLRDVVIRRYEFALWILLAAVGAVLLICCLNVAHLHLARGIERAHEIAVRLATGATRAALMRQLLTEGVLIGSVSGVVGVFLTYVGLRSIGAIGLSDIPRIENAAVDSRLLAFTVAVTFLTALASAVWPAWKTSDVQTSKLLNAGGPMTATRSRAFARNCLAISEISVAVLLAIVAGLFVRSFGKLGNSDWGFNPDRLLLMTVAVPPEVKNDLDLSNEWSEAVVDVLNETPGVERAATANAVPIRWTSWKSTPVAVNGQIVTRGWTAATWVVGSGYFQTAGIPILSGREFTGADIRASEPVIVVSRKLAERLWPSASPLGRHIQLLEVRTVNGQPVPEYISRIKRGDVSVGEDMTLLTPVEGKSWRVVGVVGDVRTFGLEHEPRPTLYMTYRQTPKSPGWKPLSADTEIKILVRSNGPTGEVIAATKGAVTSVNSRATFVEIASMADLVSQSIGGRGSNKLLLVLTTAFGVLALSVSLVGIYGIISHSVTQRVREIGIRMALGADPGHAMWIVLGYSAKLLAWGLVIGLALAWASTRVLTSHLFGVTATDTTTFMGSACLVSIVVGIAALRPARMAMRVDPVTLLR